jgi:alanyl-tRNA synthetase
VGADVQACAGTHMTSTGKVGPLRIMKTERIQDGVERFEFAAGIAAILYDQERDAIISNCSKTLRVPAEQLPAAVARFFEEWKQRGKEIERLKEFKARFRFLTSECDLIEGELKAHNKGEKVLSALEVKTKSDRLLSLEAELKELAGITVNVTVNAPTVGATAEALPVKARIVEEMERGNDRIKIFRSTTDADIKELLLASQDLRNDNAVVILGGKRAGQAHIVITVRTDIAKEGLDAAMIVKKACSILGGNGGGRPERAQGGGPYADKINAAVSEARKLAREKLALIGYK